DDPAAAADVLLRIIEADPAKIRGVKMSLLDDAAEIAVRERLPEGVRTLTGDDFHFSHLIVGDGTATTEPGAEQVTVEYSDALLRSVRRRAGAGRRGPGRGPPHPRRLRGAGPPRVLRPHLPLQDRGGLPCLAERPPAGLHHGGRHARRAQPPAPLAHHRTRRHH